MKSNTLWKPGRLVDAIEGGPPVVFVCAPAGYGKSSLIKAYTEGQARSVVWISADMRDADPARLVSHLSSATSLEVASMIPTPPTGNHPATMITLSESIGDDLIVIDDAHLIGSDKDAAECLNELISHRAKARLPLIVASRRLDNLRASNWVMNGSATVLGADDLPWTEAETGDYLAATHDLSVSPEELRQIHGLADGWPICISLMARVKVSQPTQPWGSIVENAATSPHLEQYLTDEVIGTLGHLEFEGLVACAQEEEIAPEILIDSGLLSENTWSVITGTGLVALAGIQVGTSNRFVMHQLVKSHIQTIVSQLSSQIDVHEILLTLGDTWASNGFALESCQHYLAAGLWDQAIEQLILAMPDMFASGYGVYISTLVDRIPGEMATPQLLLFKARALRHGNHGERAIETAEKAMTLAEKRGDDTSFNKARVFLWQSYRFIGLNTKSLQVDVAKVMDGRKLGVDVEATELSLQVAYQHLVKGHPLGLMKSLRFISRATPFDSRYLEARYASLLGFGQFWGLGRADRAHRSMRSAVDFYDGRDHENFTMSLTSLIHFFVELDPPESEYDEIEEKMAKVGSQQFEWLQPSAGYLEFAKGNYQSSKSHWTQVLNTSSFLDRYEAAALRGTAERLWGDYGNASRTLARYSGIPVFRSAELRFQVELELSKWHLDGAKQDAGLLASVEAECRDNFQRNVLAHCLHAQGVERHYSGDHATSIDKLGEAISISKRGKRRFWLRAEAQSDPVPLSECLRHGIETEFLAPILVRAGEPVAKHLGHAMADWKPKEKIRALQVMGDIGDRKSVAALRREALGGDESVRQAARDAINKVSLEVDGALEQLKVGLTAREDDVLALLADGQSNGEIANSLFLSGGTVKTYVNRLFHKLGVTTRMQAAKRYNDAIARDAD